MNRFLVWDHQTLARLAQDLWDQNQALRRSLQLCTCGAGSAVLSMKPETGDRAPIVTAPDHRPV